MSILVASQGLFSTEVGRVLGERASVIDILNRSTFQSPHFAFLNHPTAPGRRMLSVHPHLRLAPIIDMLVPQSSFRSSRVRCPLLPTPFPLPPADTHLPTTLSTCKARTCCLATGAATRAARRGTRARIDIAGCMWCCRGRGMRMRGGWWMMMMMDSRRLRCEWSFGIEREF